MVNLFGVYDCSADAKGRVMLPVAIKKQMLEILKQDFVIKPSIFNKSLELYPMSTWAELSKYLNKLNRFVTKNDEFIRVFNYGVRAIQLDETMRLLIPKDLMDYAKIKKDVVLAAAFDRFELWDKKAYEKFIKEKSTDFDKLAEEVMGGINPGAAGNGQ